MAIRGRTAALAVIGSALALSFIVFGVLLFRFKRGDDRNNEDILLKAVRQAEKEDNPPNAAGYWRRLVALNPFKKEYKVAYYHALVRVRDFKALATYTNNTPVKAEFTPDELRIEESLRRGWEFDQAGSNDLAVASFEDAANYNYYAATPHLIACHVRRGRLSAALTLTRPYIKRFPMPALIVQAAEWSALAARTNIIDEVKAAIPDNSGYNGLVLGYYCDALSAWVKGDMPALAEALSAVGNGVRTPLARLMALESAAMGDSAERLGVAYRNFKDAPEMLDFPLRARMAMKRFVAAHFPAKAPIRDLGRIADLALKDGGEDLDMLRVSLLAKLGEGLLMEDELSTAEKRYPQDRGIKLIREGYAKSQSR